MTRRVALLLPPTINAITGIAGNVVTAAADTGLFFAANYYPEAGLRMDVVGADFPPDLAVFTTPSFPTDAGPLLTAATTVAPYVTDTSNSFTYAANYLGELSDSVGSTDLRHFSAGAYTSYLHAPRPTLVELFKMLNVASAALTVRTDISDTVTGATNATPIVITTTAANGLVTGDEVVISGVTVNTAANGTWLIVGLSASSFQLVGSAGNGVGVGGSVFSPQQLNVPVMFGFDNSANTVTATAPTRVHDGPLTTVTRRLRVVDSLAALIGFGDVNLDPPAIATVPASIIRPVALKPGTFLSSEIVDNTTWRLDAGDFTDAVAAADRTLHFIMPVGIADSVVLDFGRYDGAGLAAYLSALLTPLPNQITVTYDAAAGAFTFAHDVGLAFGLDFATTSQLMRERLGFDALVYSGASTYTSARAVHGVGVGATFPDNDYAVSVDDGNRHYTFRAEAPIMMHSVAGTSTANVSALWDPLAGDALPLAHHFQVGDVLTATRPTLGSTQAGASPITAASNASPIRVTAAGHGLTTGDNLTIQFVTGNTAANGTWLVTVFDLDNFDLDGSIGDGAYVSGGEWWTNASFVTGAQRPGAVYTVVVQSAWDASTATPLLTLEPTASIFSTQDAIVSRDPLGVPTDDTRIILSSARRNVFMLHLEHPAGAPDTFGFPAVAWPPSEKTNIATSTANTATLRTLPDYDAATLSIPVSGSYTSPQSYNLLAPDYMLIVLRVPCASDDIHTHSYRGSSFPIFAKMMLTYPYNTVSESMLFTTFAGHARVGENMVIEFQNPNGTLVDFNGRPHTFTLLFTVFQDSAVLPCF